MFVTASERSIAAGRIDQFHQHQHAASRQPATWPHQVGVIPSQAQWFQGRAEVASLARALDGGGTAVVGSAGRVPAGGVVVGMGGVGKTQLAAHFARAAWQAGELDVLVWITASSASAAVTGYAQAAVEVLGSDPGDSETAARAFLAWLEPKPQERPCRWLVVLDDVVDPGDLCGWWPPASPHGRTVATTRRKDAALLAGGRCLIEIGLFAPEQALAYLLDALAAHGRAEPAEELAALAVDLGHLPLALSQAAAYLGDTGTSCRGYRALLADRTRLLADAAPDVLPDDQTHTVAAAWALSLDHADTLRPAGLARPLLHMAAFLNPNGIPGTILTSLPALLHFTAVTDPDTARVTPDQVALALHVLRRLSLIEYAPDTAHQTVRVHQLIQRAVRDGLTLTQRDLLARTAANGLTAVWPEVERNTNLSAVLRANTTALADYSGSALYLPGVHPVLCRMGRSLGEAGQVRAARNYFHDLAITAANHLGPDHLDVLVVRSNLAQWQGHVGDVTGAAVAFAELLDDHLQLLGPDHPHILATRNRLVRWRGEKGDAAGAAALTAELLEEHLRVFGPDDPNTLTTRNNLAHWRGKAGDAKGAAVAFAELLAVRLRVLGPDHPDTLATRNNFAHWRGEAGDAVGAAAALAELLDDQVRVLGPDHPRTLITRHNLALWLWKLGDAAGAVARMAELLDDQARVLGPDHPATLTIRQSIALWLVEVGDVMGAAVAFAVLLEDLLRVLGPDHPKTLSARNNLAGCWGEAGDVARAIVLTAQLLDDQVRVFGPDHPDTLTVRNNLAHWQRLIGDSDVE